MFKNLACRWLLLIMIYLGRLLEPVLLSPGMAKRGLPMGLFMNIFDHSFHHPMGEWKGEHMILLTILLTKKFRPFADC